ncbi:hypothetical protein [uncultured Thiothrix sp.]|uniref:hypothetical protein n=1 Tax=uncultured Thiothrix sp. TaxID=223185 RepID=UPI002615D88A|nr:hypothetical protein [uncultured Thiothrix sp.]HMT94568.1 hypothetical protein [Thiolinea sp.]
MQKVLQRSALALCVLALAGCGGGDGNQLSNDGGGNNTTTGAKFLEVSASSRQLGSSGDKPVTISAIAKDVNNNILKDATVQFSVNNEATIEADTATATTGVKTALLTPGLENPENRTVTVTIKSGTLLKTLDIAITGTTLVVDGPARIALNTPTTFTAKLKDSAGKALANETVTINSSLNNALTPLSGSGFMTDANGEIQFTINAAVSGTDTISVSALGVSSSKTLEISGDDFTITSTNSEIKVKTPETISLKWTQNGVAQANKTINLAATRGEIKPSQMVMTDIHGQATFYVGSSTAGGTVVTATDASTGLSTSLTREFVATTPANLNMQVEKELLIPESSTNVIAVVKDAADNPVKNQVVVFNLEDTVGGKLSSSTATTDSLGKATIGYTAGNATSAKDGVKITSSLRLTDPNASPVADDYITLTVGGQGLRIVLGEDEKIVEEGLFYKKSFGVIVTDSAGNPVKDKKVDFALIPLAYAKGSFAPCGVTLSDGTLSTKPIFVQTASCVSEDIDSDGLLDAGEDLNSSGRLEPTNAATVTNSAVTDSDGKVLATVIYPQSHALWNKVRLTARILVSGSEYVESTDFVLPVLAADVGSCDISPPNAVSPYGVDASCLTKN